MPELNSAAGSEEAVCNAASGDVSLESLDDLLIGGMKYIQARDGYRFSIDSVLLAHFPDLEAVRRAVDLGAGNGLLALLLCCRQPGLGVDAVELQASMAERARRNVALNGREGQVNVLQADVRQIKDHLPAGAYNLVICNPPFFKSGHGKTSRNEEERVARHELCATLGDFIAAASFLLADRGILSMVLPAARLQEAMNLLGESRLALARLRTVHSRSGADAVLVLLEAGKSRRRPVRIMEPLYIYEEDGSYSGEIMVMYGET